MTLHWPDPDLPPINLYNAPHLGEAIASPCVAKCHVQQGLCTGCGRTLDEITDWSIMTPIQRQVVIERLASHKEYPCEPYLSIPTRNRSPK